MENEENIMRIQDTPAEFVLTNRSVLKKLLTVQSKLKCPKTQSAKMNGVERYKFRDLEDILEAVKPLLVEVKATILLNDELVLVGDRYYVRATARFIDIETCTEESATAYAREEEKKNTMDGSQITGASSSYARKYALNALLALDDNKDSDSTNKGKDKKEKQPTADITKEQIAEIEKLFAKLPERITEMLKYYKVDSLEKLTAPVATKIIELRKKEIAAEQQKTAEVSANEQK